MHPRYLPKAQPKQFTSAPTSIPYIVVPRTVVFDFNHLHVVTIKDIWARGHQLGIVPQPHTEDLLTLHTVGSTFLSGTHPNRFKPKTLKRLKRLKLKSILLVTS